MTIGVGYTTIANNIHYKDNRIAQVGKSDGIAFQDPITLALRLNIVCSIVWW